MDIRPRRTFFKRLLVSLTSLSYAVPALAQRFAPGREHAPATESLNDSADEFAAVDDRVWLGEKYWAVPMEDWSVRDGRIEFSGIERNSRVNILTSILREGNGEFNVSARAGRMGTGKGKAGTAGFGIGVKDELDSDIKSACYFGKGIHAGISLAGYIFIEDQRERLPEDFDYSSFDLQFSCRRRNALTEMRLSCRATDSRGPEIFVTYKIPSDVSGIVTLVNNIHEKGGETFWFRNPQVRGSKVSEKPQNAFGPILWSMYTLSKGILKLTAQMPPLGSKDSDQVELHLNRQGTWKLSGTAKIKSDSRTATFRLANWDHSAEVPYKLVYRNDGKVYEYAGAIRREPIGRPLRFGGLTCQHASAFPYSPLVSNLKKHDPDILYFSGDQLYENNGGYPIKREPVEASILSYLGKWYMFGWAFGEVMRDRPTICTPDDHDVFHGNLWGEGGEPVSLSEWEKVRDAHGGYVQSTGMVNVVADTQCGHLPDAYHSSPLKSGIKSWYTGLVYGGVSFAIVSDRMFKSGPDKVRNAAGRIDHISTPVSKGALERADLEFLGAMQMQFLEHWVQDWRGAAMKVLLSQTIFCNVGTHHGTNKTFLYGDMDSGGWPKQQRDAVIRTIRKASTFHINGDQHLPFIVQYSVDEDRDAGWTFCTPAISTGYIRWGQPDLVRAPFRDRPPHGLPNTGIYQDIFGNSNYIYAVGNPEDDYTDKNRYIQAQKKSSGFGIITFDTKERTITMEAYRFLADKDKPSRDDQFPGWPLKISQTDNDGRKPSGYLPLVKVNKPDQVIKIIDESDGQLVSAIRMKGSSFQPRVFRDGTYTVVIGDTKEIKGLKPEKEIPKRAIDVTIG